MIIEECDSNILIETLSNDHIMVNLTSDSGHKNKLKGAIYRVQLYTWSSTWGTICSWKRFVLVQMSYKLDL